MRTLPTPVRLTSAVRVGTAVSRCVFEFTGLGIDRQLASVTLVNGYTAGRRRQRTTLTNEEVSGLLLDCERAYLLGPQRRVHGGGGDEE